MTSAEISFPARRSEDIYPMKSNLKLRRRHKQNKRLIMSNDGEGYGRNCKSQRDLAIQCLRQWPLDLKDGERILDVGCANGSLTKELLVQIPANIDVIVGIDISSGMIESAKENNPDPRIVYEVADISDESTMKEEWWGTFDKIVSFNVMHWVEDQKRALKIMMKLLKPGGQILMEMAGRSHAPTVKGVEEILYSDKYYEYVKYSRERYEALLHPWKREFHLAEHPDEDYHLLASSIGFQVDDCLIQNFLLPMLSKEQLKGTYSQVLPMVHEVPEELKQSLVDDFLNAFLKCNDQENFSCDVCMPILIVRLQKLLDTA